MTQGIGADGGGGGGSLDDLIAFFEVTQRLLAEERLLAYHDRSDGGLWATVAEMAFAGRTGVAHAPQACANETALLCICPRPPAPLPPARIAHRSEHVASAFRSLRGTFALYPPPLLPGFVYWHTVYSVAKRCITVPAGHRDTPQPTFSVPFHTTAVKCPVAIEKPGRS